MLGICSDQELSWLLWVLDNLCVLKNHLGCLNAKGVLLDEYIETILTKIFNLQFVDDFFSLIAFLEYEFSASSVVYAEIVIGLPRVDR